MVHLGHKHKPGKAQRKVEAAQQSLLRGEDIWFFGTCTNVRPNCDSLVLTNTRLLGMMRKVITYETALLDIVSLTPDEKKQTLTISTSDGNPMTFKSVPREDHGPILHFFNHGKAEGAPAQVVEALAAQRSAERGAKARQELAKERAWPNTRVVGSRLTSKASQAILRQCHGSEEPWLILVSSGGAGLLTAFNDRLAIIKTGAMTSLMAGSLGGERAATFHYRDVTGIEYNSGFVNGVLEILTPSYSGSANKDFWRGSNKSRNADSNDPWTLSNCLPLTKGEYNKVLDDVNELRSRMSKAKEIQVNVAAATSASSLADEIRKLAELKDAGVLTEEEFAYGKAKLLSE